MSESNKQNSANSRKPYPRHPYAFVDLSEEELAEYRRAKTRRLFPLVVPDDGPNGFTLPGGIGPGSRLRIKAEKDGLRITRGPYL